MTQNGTVHDGSNNGVHVDAIPDSPHDLLWDTLPPKVVSELEKPLDPGLVSYRKGRKGQTYAYIEGRTAIEQANRIFGCAPRHAA